MDKVLFLSLLPNDYSRTGVIYREYKGGKEFILIQGNKVHKIRQILKIRKSISRQQIIVVMSPSHSLCIYLRLFGRKQIILDAGWSLSESNSVRDNRKIFGFNRRLFIYVIDFLSFHLSKVVVLESKQQIDYVRKKFLVKHSKLKVNYTGFNELNYENVVAKIPYDLDISTIKNKKVIFFRGKHNKEAGIKEILSIFELLHDDYTKNIALVIATDSNVEQYCTSKSVNILARTLEYSEIKWLYEFADISIGQMNRLDRLENTIPHKAFEAMYFRKPYVSFNTASIREILPSRNFAFLIDDYTELQEIFSGLNNGQIGSDVLDEMSCNAKLKYETEFSQAILRDKFSKIIKDLTCEN